MAAKTPKNPPESTTPADFPVQPHIHQPLPGADYSYTVELVGNIQHQLGKLTEAVNGLTETTKGHSQKLNDACRDIHVAKVILACVGGLLTVIATFAGIAFKAYLDHLWRSPK